MTDSGPARAVASHARAALAALLLVGVAAAVDAVLLLEAGGARLRPIEALGLTVAAVATIALVRWVPRPELLAVPVIGFLVFRLSLGHVVEVPDGAVIRDAQAGLAVLVIVGAQTAVVAVGLGLSR